MNHAFTWVAALLLAASIPMQASATTFETTFSGGGVSADVVLTFGSTVDSKYGQAFEVTDISGTFSDANIGIANATIGPLVTINHSPPESTNMLAPGDFSRFAVAMGLPDENHGFLTFDNLYWPGGSPQTATDYPGAGGFLDIYGLLFNIGQGRVVDIYSNGIFGPPGSAPIEYGVAVAMPDHSLDYVADGVSASAVSAVSEPGNAVLVLAGLGILQLARRQRLRR
jgi:hypothetical protein